MPTPFLGVTSTSGTGQSLTAAQQNLASAGDISSLTTMLNNLNLGAQQAANAGRIPGQAGLESQSSSNIASELQGQLPQDVLNLIQQQGAERGVTTGSPGSPNAEAAALAALGLTSFNQQQTGQQNLTAAEARNPVAPLINPQSELITPAQAGQYTTS